MCREKWRWVGNVTITSNEILAHKVLCSNLIAVNIWCIWAKMGVWQSKATRRDGRNVDLLWQQGQASLASPPMMSNLAAWGSSHTSSQRVESHQGSCWVPVSSGQQSEEVTDFWSLNNTKLISTMHSGNYKTHSFTNCLSNSIKNRVLLEKLTTDQIVKLW